MTTTTRNEAAERLRAMSHREVGGGVGDQIRVALDLALAAERRVTVERIRARLHAVDYRGNPTITRDEADASLDEEAAR
jgi:hypothetical protein